MSRVGVEALKKTCTKCGHEYPATLAFFYGDKQKKDGLRPSCKDCSDVVVKAYRTSDRGIQNHLKVNNKYKKSPKGCVSEKKYRQSDPHKEKAKIAARRHSYKKHYGITVEEYEEMYRQQSGECAICGRQPTKTRLGVDHDHGSGKVRQLLCHPCNLALGRFEKFSKQFNDYLERNK